MARWRFYLSGGDDLSYHTYGIVVAGTDDEAYKKGFEKFGIQGDAWDEANAHFGMEWTPDEQEQAEDDDTAPFFSVEELLQGETMEDFEDEEEPDEGDAGNGMYGERPDDDDDED